MNIAQVDPLTLPSLPLAERSHTTRYAMTQALPKLITFDEFIAWYPENSEVRYELRDGVIVEMSPPAGEHEEIKGFLNAQVVIAYTKVNLPYFIPNQAIVKPVESESGYSPDVLLLNRPNLKSESLWKKFSTVTLAASIPLVIEVVSTNWRDDYYKKLADYEEIGIPEYWIVDYASFGARKFIGNPKQPTISICVLIEGEYQISQFRGDDRIRSLIFPELNLTAQQIFNAGIRENE